MQKRQFVSNIILFLFLILVISTAFFSDIFQNKSKSGPEVIEQAKLFGTNELKLIQRISLKNKSGEYIFENIQKDFISSWHMVSPPDISTNSLFVEKLLNELTSIKVKKEFPDEKVTTSNFSLDKPTSTISLIYKSGKTITLTLGLVNSIDNSTYLKISNRPGIFHVEAPNVPLENATIVDLTESHIILFNQDTIFSFKIFRSNQKSIPAIFEMNKKNGQWFDQLNTPLSNQKVSEYLQEVSSLNSSFIIEKPSEPQRKQINSMGNSSNYLVSIQDNNISSDYYISGTLKELSDIDLKNEESFIIKTDKNSTIYIVKREFLELFARKTDTLKSAPSNTIESP